MSTTVSYKGSTIATLSNETKTLTTAGTWVEGDISITDNGGTAAISVVDTTDSHGGTIREITAIDISDTTATAGDVASGKYFYTASGVKTAGTSTGGGSVTITDEANSTGITCVIVTGQGSSTVETWETIYDGSVTIENRSISLPNLTNQFILGDTWRVILDNVVYVYEVEHSDVFNTNYIGNVNIASDNASTGDPTLFYKVTDYMSGDSYLSGEHTLKLERLVTASPTPTPVETWETIFEATEDVLSDTPYGYFSFSTIGTYTISVGSNWRITLNGSEYLVTAKQYNDQVIIGNPKWNEGEDDGSDIPFAFFNNGHVWLGGTSLPIGNTYLIKIEKEVM